MGTNEGGTKVYFGYQDDDKKKPMSVKVADAVEKYTAKYNRAPTELLCNPQDVIQYPGLEIVGAPWLRHGILWLAIGE
jgi:hypothetical protein